MEKTLGIKFLSKASGVAQQTLRAWESRYRAFEPSRDNEGQRLYSLKDLQKAKLLSLLTQEGLSISKLAPLELEALEEKALELDLLNNLNDFEISINYQALIEAAKTDLSLLGQELERLRITLGAREFIFQLLLPLLAQTGLEVSAQKMTVTQEHILSTFLRAQLSQMQIPVTLNPKDQRLWALATIDGNWHEFPLLIAHLLCRLQQKDAYYLGASHPASDLAQTLNGLKVDTLILSVIPNDEQNNLKKMKNYLQQLDKDLKRDITVVIGGMKSPLNEQFQHIKEVRLMLSFKSFEEWLAVG